MNYTNNDIEKISRALNKERQSNTSKKIENNLGVINKVLNKTKNKAEINNFLILNKEQAEHLKKLKDIIKKKMPTELYKHSIGTLNYSTKLANVYFLNFFQKSPINRLIELYYKLCIASILHDYGKIFSYKELLKIAIEKNLCLLDFELKCKPIIHGFVAPFLLERDFGIVDIEINNAVKSHTIGSLNMSIIDKILYISDKVEETRDYEGVKFLRKLSLEDFNKCLLEVYKSNIIYVITKGSLLHPDTAKIWNNICGGL